MWLPEFVTCLPEFVTWLPEYSSLRCSSFLVRYSIFPLCFVLSPCLSSTPSAERVSKFLAPGIVGGCHSCETCPEQSEFTLSVIEGKEQESRNVSGIRTGKEIRFRFGSSEDKAGKEAKRRPTGW